MALVRPWRARGASGSPGAAALARPLATIGFYSYSIYLWHIPVREWIVARLARAGVFQPAGPTLAYVLQVGTFALLSILVGIALARAIELPALAIRDRLFPSRSGTLA